MRRAGIVLAAAVAYLALALVAWWHVWTGGVAHTIAADGWGDPAQQVWFIAWVPHALGAGLNPFVSHAMFAPKGINLVANTSILLPALVLSPITMVFGPLVAFNVGVLIAPAISALAAFVVFRRYTTFAFGAWLGGLFYGFSPFVLNDLADGHLHITLLVFPPLILAVLDDLLVRDRQSPWSRGALLGVLLAAQFLTSTEVLFMVAVLGVVAVLLLAVANLSRTRRRARRVLTGFGVAAVVAGALLAWPVDVLLLGPRRYHGTVFAISPESFAVGLQRVVWPKGGSPPQLWSVYIGIPLLLICAIACWRVRSGAVRLAAALFVVALILAMGQSLHLTPRINTGIPLPDRLIAHVQMLDNLSPGRYVVLCDLFVGLMLAAGLGALRDWLGGQVGRTVAGDPLRSAVVGAGVEDGASTSAATAAPIAPPRGVRLHGARKQAGRWDLARKHAGGRDRTALPTLPASLIAGVIGLLALVSPALGTRWPYPARQVSIPAVYRSHALTHLAPGSILFAYPVMNGFAADPMIWQAEEEMPYEMVAGYGFIPSPNAHPYGSLPASPLTNLFSAAQFGLLGPVGPSSPPPSVVQAVAAQLRSLDVSDIVVLPTGAQPGRLVQVLEIATGRRPVTIDGAWVWLRLRS